MCCTIHAFIAFGFNVIGAAVAVPTADSFSQFICVTLVALQFVVAFVFCLARSWAEESILEMPYSSNKIKAPCLGKPNAKKPAKEERCEEETNREWEQRLHLSTNNNIRISFGV